VDDDNNNMVIVLSDVLIKLHFNELVASFRISGNAGLWSCSVHDCAHLT